MYTAWTCAAVQPGAGSMVANAGPSHYGVRGATADQMHVLLTTSETLVAVAFQARSIKAARPTHDAIKWLVDCLLRANVSDGQCYLLRLVVVNSSSKNCFT